MNDTISTREFSIDDYDAAVELWKRVEGLEIAEGDDKESVARFLTRNPGLSRVATDGSVIVGVSLCGHDGRRGHIYHLADCRTREFSARSFWSLTIMPAGASFGGVATGKSFLARWRWGRMSRLRRQ
ncbi:MAG: hypothetical protein DME46_08660 [Verrucomicrobia bacterium]|nr:MAG: hypothetical protein DME46_08660 [Verrucomicrobiota bacterium]